MERILREHVLDIRDEQFLMLLLMMNAENQNGFNVVEKFFVSIRKEVVNVRIDRRAIALRFPDCRPRDLAAQVASVHITGGVIVGIEKISVLRNFGTISGSKFLKNKSLKNPCG